MWKNNTLQPFWYNIMPYLPIQFKIIFVTINKNIRIAYAHIVKKLKQDTLNGTYCTLYYLYHCNTYITLLFT